MASGSKWVGRLRKRKQNEGLEDRYAVFDSIDAMNSDGDLLVKRKKGDKKNLIVLTSCSTVFFVVGVLIGYFASVRDGHVSTAASSSDRFNYIQFIIGSIDKERIRNTLQNYSSEPRLAGTPKNFDLSQQIEKEWWSNGLDEVHLATYHVLLSFPNASNPNVVQLVNTSSGNVVFESHKYEVPLTDHEKNQDIVPPFNSHSHSGNVTGKMVYVNYGRIEDFLLLTKQGLNISGCIVIVRYGKIFRGDKLQNAEDFGAIGAILYSDPKDYNMDDNASNTYPNSWWLPPSGIQRGAVSGDGDPDTPLYPSTHYAYRIPDSEVASGLPQIPIQPIGYNDAEFLLSKLGGAEAPADWQGKLPFTYRLGPGHIDPDLSVRVVVNNYDEVKPVHNVIGYIRGSEEPDRYVLLGNHHDAWTFGAVDPLSGSAALTELTRVFGLMLRAGHRPRRTIVFCSWDAEEYGLYGSMEWVEDNLRLLHQRAVAYLNMDFTAKANYTMSVSSTPLLQDLAYAAARHIPSIDPSAAKTLYDLWKLRPRTKNASADEPYLLYTLGSGSDMAAFYQRAGVPCMDMLVTYDEVHINSLDYPLYHSSYETFFAYDTYFDPGFHAARAITQFWGILASELAWSEIIPMNVERYSSAVSKFHSSLLMLFGEKWSQKGVNIADFSSAVKNFTTATRVFQKNLDQNKDIIKKSPLAVRRINDQLIYLERIFLDPEGLPGRPEQKHIVFAPSMFDSYVDNAFPGIVDTMAEIDSGHLKWEQLKKQVFVATHIVQSAARALHDIGL